MMRLPVRAALKPVWLVRRVVLICGLFAFPNYVVGDDRPKPASVPTFTRDVAPILQKNCHDCHRKGQVAPFSLETYEHARKRANDIVEVTSSRSMPPWKPERGVGPRLTNDRSMSPEDIAVLKAWADAGAPRGDVKDMPARAGSSEHGWVLGKPDLVVEMTEEYTIPASGPEVYRCFVVPTNLPNDVYISAVEFRPGNARVVHHLVTFFDTTGAAKKLDEADPAPGYSSYSGAGFVVAGELGGWTPGNKPYHLPEGVGRPFPKSADVIIQVHYHPSGKPEKDRSKLGIHFAEKPVKQSFLWANATSYKFKIPAGAPDVEVKASWYVPADMEALAVNPHMHKLGHDFRMYLTLPSGRRRDLLHIADWNADWQEIYYFESPVTLPKGSVVHVVGRYDNSAHARNPNNPPKLVTFGQKSTDEMCVGYIGIVKKGQDLTQPGAKDDLFSILLNQAYKNSQRAEDAKTRRQGERHTRGGARP